jgi:hypothetical protein
MIANPILVSSVGPPNYIASITLPGAILEAYQSLSAEREGRLCGISTGTWNKLIVEKWNKCIVENSSDRAN